MSIKLKEGDLVRVYRASKKVYFLNDMYRTIGMVGRVIFVKPDSAIVSFGFSEYYYPLSCLAHVKQEDL